MGGSKVSQNPEKESTLVVGIKSNGKIQLKFI
jgi:hypothetical protein